MKVSKQYRKFAKRTTIAALLLLVAGRMFLWHQGIPPQSVLALGYGTTQIMLHPTKVEAFRLDPERAEIITNPDGLVHFNKGERHLGDYLIVGDVRPVSQQLTSELAPVMLRVTDSANLSFMACGFAPGVAFRFWQGQQATDVLLCFGCDEMEIWIYAPGKLQRPIAIYHNAFPVWSKRDTENAQIRQEFLKIVKAEFPDDKALQALTALH